MKKQPPTNGNCPRRSPRSNYSETFDCVTPTTAVRPTIFHRLARPANGVAGHDDWQERERERYRIRLGLRGTLLDDWFFGIRLETSTSSRSTNVTFGDDNRRRNRTFAKTSDSINVGQAYLGYKGFKDITLTGGRMPNPLVNTPMVWDPDINPEGLAEQWKHTFSFGETGGESARTAKTARTSRQSWRSRSR